MIQGDLAVLLGGGQRVQRIDRLAAEVARLTFRAVAVGDIATHIPHVLKSIRNELLRFAEERDAASLPDRQRGVFVFQQHEPFIGDHPGDLLSLAVIERARGEREAKHAARQ